jgi:hypothetical protein
LNKNTDKISEDRRHSDRYNNSLDSDDISANRKKKPIAYAGPEQIVYEGGKVYLEGSCNLDQNEEEPNKNIVYDWGFVEKQSDTTISDQEFKATRNPVFTAPYVDFQPVLNTERQGNVEEKIKKYKEKYKTHSNLIFKLVVTDRSTNLKSEPSFVTIIVKMVQRALILQGGGSLGAYELGAYKALCKILFVKDIVDGENVRKNRPLFDIITGASIGALNAA